MPTTDITLQGFLAFHLVYYTRKCFKLWLRLRFQNVLLLQYVHRKKVVNCKTIIINCSDQNTANKKVEMVYLTVFLCL